MSDQVISFFCISDFGCSACQVSLSRSVPDQEPDSDNFSGRPACRKGPVSPLILQQRVLHLPVHPKDSEPYQGVVEVTGYNLSDTLENYFLRSEQIKTKIMLEISLTDNDSTAAGLLVQELPTEDPNHEDDFNTVAHLVNTLTKDELTNLEADEVLFRLFNQFKVRRFDAINVNFKCGCSRRKCLDTIHQLGKEEVYGVINSSADPEHVESLVMTCSQCGKKYIFKKEDIDKLFKNEK